MKLGPPFYRSPRWLVAAALMGCHGASPSSPAGHAAPVKTAQVVAQEMPIYLTGLGTAQAQVTARVHAQVEGRIEAVHFTEGAQVAQGAPLVDLDARPFRIALQQAQAALARDRASYRNAVLVRDRNRTLAAQGLVAQSALTDSEALACQGAATLAADRAAVANAALQLEYAHVTAPIAGRAGLRGVDRGNVVRPSDANALVTITQTDPIAVMVSVPEQALGAVAQALGRGPVMAEALDRTSGAVLGRGRLLMIDNEISPATGTLRLKSLFDNPAHTLWPGQFVQVRLELARVPNALMVPEEALLRQGDSDAVFVVDAHQRAQRRNVTVGERQDGAARVCSGLVAGERVVTEGQYRLQAGSPVTEGATP